MKPQQLTYEQLPAAAAETLRALLLLYGAEPVEEDALLSRMGESTRLSGAECRIGLHRLRAAGIASVAARSWNERLWFVTAPAFFYWQQEAWPYRRHERNSESQLVHAGFDWRYAPAAVPLGRQLLYVLSLLAANGMAYTGKGVLPKPTIAKLAKSISFDASLLEPFGVIRLVQSGYPPAVAFMLEAGCALGLLNRRPEGLALNEQALASWLALDGERREALLLDWLCNELLPHAGLSAHTAAALRSVPPGEWIAVADVEAWTCRLLDSLHDASESPGTGCLSDADNGMADRWCNLFHSCGWMELAEDEEQRRKICWKRQPGLTEELIVQPDGELLAVNGCSYSILWELELIAERISDDELSVYRLTAGSLARAVQYGRTKADIVRFLVEAGGGAALPESVTAMLEQWGGERQEYDETGFDKGGAGGRRRVPIMYGAEPESESGAESESDGKDEPVELPVLLESFIRFGDKLVNCSLVDSGEDRVWPELVSDADKLPSMWTRQLRSYHHSTRKELLETALQLETAVRLKLEGRLRSFVPQRLERHGTDWTVIGKLRDMDNVERVRLTPDMWQEMQLLLPESGGVE